MNKNIDLIKKNSAYIWFLFNAESQTLGRLSTEICKVLIGKNNACYNFGNVPQHGVIIINAEKITVTGKKFTDKLYCRHSGRPGGLKIETFKELQKRLPLKSIENSIRGMLPKNSFGRKLFTKLKIYKGSQHPHKAQYPVEIFLN